jgi:CheY-like chemotaxis protein
MGSDIKVRSHLGKGSVFWFEVELDMGKAEDALTYSVCSGKAGIEGTHIIIADDNEMNANMLADLLETEGVTSTVCLNGRDAVEEFLKSGTASSENEQNHKTDIILMDIQMPVMNGLEASAEIRRSSHPDAKTVPIIAVTAFAFGKDVDASIEAGMNAHVSKPIHMGRLCSLMSALMKSDNEIRD